MFVNRLRCMCFVCALTVLPCAVLLAQDMGNATVSQPPASGSETSAAPANQTAVQPPANETAVQPVLASQQNLAQTTNQTQTPAQPVEPKVIEPAAVPDAGNMTATTPATPPATTPQAQAPTTEAASQAKPYMEIKDVEAPTEWVWGEVVSADAQAGAITIKHLDYDTYEEVQKVLSVTDKTLFENAKDVTDIKPGDHITADYRVNGNKNEIEMLVVDKLETGSSAGTTDEAAPSSPAPVKTTPEEPSSSMTAPISENSTEVMTLSPSAQVLNSEAGSVQEQSLPEPVLPPDNQEIAAPVTP